MSWFPLPKEQVEDSKFAELSPAAKLYYWLLQSEYNWGNRNGQLSRGDSWFAAALNLSLPMIRTVRRKFKENGWIGYTPGFKLSANKAGIATSYNNVCWSNPPEQGQFARIDRHTFNMMLNQIRLKNLKIAEVLVWLYLYYWSSVTQHNGKWFITKRELSDLTSVPKAARSVKTLYDRFKYSGGAHLFKYEEEYQKFIFTEWNTTQFNSCIAEQWYEEIQARARKITVHQIKEEAVNRLIVLFRSKYKSCFNKQCSSIYWDHSKQLKELAERIGISKTEIAIQNYFKELHDKKTMTDFLKNADTYLPK
jgi:hypothetical protein